MTRKILKTNRRTGEHQRSRRSPPQLRSSLETRLKFASGCRVLRKHPSQGFPRETELREPGVLITRWWKGNDGEASLSQLRNHPQLVSHTGNVGRDHLLRVFTSKISSLGFSWKQKDLIGLGLGAP